VWAAANTNSCMMPLLNSTLFVLVAGCLYLFSLPVFVHAQEVCLLDHFILDGVCTACAPGTTRPAGDTVGVDDAGSICEAIICASLTPRVLNHECVACTPPPKLTGHHDGATADASGEDTVCTGQATLANAQNGDGPAVAGTSRLVVSLLLSFHASAGSLGRSC
jgi:hypothetical protein